MQDDTIWNYSVGVIKEKLSRNIPALMDDILDEIQAAIADQIPMTDGTSPQQRLRVFLDLCVFD